MEMLRHTIQPQEDGWRISRILRGVMHVSATQLKTARWHDCIRLDGVSARATDYVHAGQELVMLLETPAPLYHPTPWPLPLCIPYQDEALLVVDKPAPLPSQSSQRQPDNTLENALCAWAGNSPDYIYRPVNRLDKGTSGLMVVAQNAHTQQLLQMQLHTPDMCREYLAITDGAPADDSGVIDLPIGKAAGATVRRCIDPCGKPARTHYRVLHRADGRALIALRLETGRTHQIRVHLASLGCPVTGDFLYGTERAELPGRFALHSHRLQLRHPLTGQLLILCSPLPPELSVLLPDGCPMPGLSTDPLCCTRPDTSAFD